MEISGGKGSGEHGSRWCVCGGQRSGQKGSERGLSGAKAQVSRAADGGNRLEQKESGTRARALSSSDPGQGLSCGPISRHPRDLQQSADG